jgi:hypothetical protein
MSDYGGYYRRLARSMRRSIILILVGLSVITGINLYYGVPPAPIWFYLVMTAMSAVFWLLTNLFLAWADRRK